MPLLWLGLDLSVAAFLLLLPHRFGASISPKAAHGLQSLCRRRSEMGILIADGCLDFVEYVLIVMFYSILKIPIPLGFGDSPVFADCLNIRNAVSFRQTFAFGEPHGGKERASSQTQICETLADYAPATLNTSY